MGGPRLEQGPQPERVEEVALIEWPADEPAPTRYWLARLPGRFALAKLVATAKACGRVEQDYRELKDELGLDRFEGRSWQGFQSHPLDATAASDPTQNDSDVSRLKVCRTQRADPKFV